MNTYEDWQQALKTHPLCSKEEVLRGMPCFRMDLGEVEACFIYPTAFCNRLVEKFPFLEKQSVVNYLTEQYEDQIQEKLTLRFVAHDAERELLLTAFHRERTITFSCEKLQDDELILLFGQLYTLMSDFCKEEGVNRLLFSVNEYEHQLPTFLSQALTRETR